MHAIRVQQHGGPEVLQWESAPDPAPQPGDVLVRVEAVGLNFIEVYQRKGLYKVETPYTPGSECAGTVIEVGPGVTQVQAGDRIATVNAKGSYAERAVVAADRAVPLPDGIDFRQGAAAMLQGMTAHYLATSTYALQPGDTALIHAAAGGVGLLLCQIARQRGARVIGTASTEEKAALARHAGADEVIIYTQTDFEEEVRRLTSYRGVNVIYDSVGKTTFLKGLSILVPRGLMVLFGQSSGPVDPFDPQILNQRGSLFLTRPTVAHYTLTREELLARSGDVFRWIRDGSLRLTIGAEFPLSKAADAHRALEGRNTVGKVLLRMDR